MERIYETSGASGRLDSRVITIARESVEIGTRRFTIAHEIGHQELQGNGSYLRIVRQPGQLHQHANNPEEMEADAFAETLLMPEKAVRPHFDARFRRVFDKRNCDQNIAFFLSGGRLKLSELRQMEMRRFARLIGGVTSFGGPQFESLAGIFKVSQSAMAERLITLGLVS